VSAVDRGRKRLLSDERGVSVTVGYVLTLAIGAVLLSGVVIGVGGVVDSQTDRAVRGDLCPRADHGRERRERRPACPRGGGRSVERGRRDERLRLGRRRSPDPSRGDSLPDHGR